MGPGQLQFWQVILTLWGSKILVQSWIVFMLHTQSLLEIPETCDTHSNNASPSRSLCGVQSSTSAGKTSLQTEALSSGLLHCGLFVLHSSLICYSYSWHKMLSQSLWTGYLCWVIPNLWFGGCDITLKTSVDSWHPPERPWLIPDPEL